MPQSTQRQAPDELDEILGKLGASDDPRDRAAIRRLAEEKRAPNELVVRPFSEPGASDEFATIGERKIFGKTMEDVIKEYFSRGTDVAAGLAGGGISGAASAALIPEVIQRLLPNNKPPEFVSPENASSLTSLLTNLGTRATMGGAKKLPALLLKGLIEGAVPGGTYVAESAREGNPLTGASRDFAVGMPVLGGIIGAGLGHSNYIRATEGPAALAQQAPGKIMSGELANQTFPSVQEARETLGNLAGRSKQFDALQQQLEKLKTEAGGITFPGGQAAQKSAADAERQADVMLRSVKQARDTMRQELIDISKEQKLMPVNKRKLETELEQLMNSTSLTQKASRTKRINQITAELDGYDDKVISLAEREAKLKQNLIDYEPRIKDLESLSSSATNVSQTVLDNWNRVKDDAAMRTRVVAEMDKRTGWKHANLSTEDKAVIRKLATEAPNEMIDKTIGAAMSGAVKQGEESALNWARSMNRVLNEEEKEAMRTIAAKRMISESYDQTRKKVLSFGVTKGSENVFTPSGLSRLGKDATNELFGSSRAYDNLMHLSEQLHNANQPGLKFLGSFKGGSVLGAMAMFFWGSRFASQNPGLATVGIGTGTIVAGKIGWDKFVDVVVRKAHDNSNPSQALFKALEGRFLIPAKGAAGTAAGRAIANPLVRQKNPRPEED